ncbi:MAG: hypothetical protein NTV65_02130, partial [Proteobacteria bacterium]|nr:hypothetical protein [Pseudomonadota bacterium]
QDRSKELAPLKEGVAALEKSISTLERSIITAQEQLARASNNGDAGEIRKNSQALAAAQRELEKQISSWEDETRKIEQLEKRFVEQLKVFD